MLRTRSRQGQDQNATHCNVHEPFVFVTADTVSENKTVCKFV
jgi:hypothetical protein